jgi:hypothetical protein
MSSRPHRLAGPGQRSGRVSRGNLLLALGGGLAVVSALSLSFLTSGRGGREGSASSGGPGPRPARPEGVVLAGETVAPPASTSPAATASTVLQDPLASPESPVAASFEPAAPASLGAQSATAAAPTPAALAAQNDQDDGPKLRYESVPGAKKERVRQEDLRTPKRRSAQAGDPAQAGQQPAGAQKDPAGNKKAKQAQNRRFPKKQPAPEGGG